MKKAQTLGIAIMTGLIVFIIGMVIINFIAPEVTQTRLDLNCANGSDISDGTKLLCLGVDITVIYWVLLVFSLLIGGIVSRLNIQ